MRPVPPRLIVTADDFGLSPAVSRGILRAFRHGIVRHTAFLVTFPDVTESAALLQGADGLDVGIHLTLTCGSPAAGSRRVPALLGRGERFPALPELLARAAAGRLPAEEVRTEWRAQVERGLRLGLTFSSLTGHQHVHMWPPLLDIAIELALEYRIPAVRLSRFPPGNGGLLRRAALEPLARRAEAPLRAAGLRRNDAVVDFGGAAPAEAPGRLLSRLRRMDAEVVELVSHPGYVDVELARRDPYTSGRPRELEALISPELARALAEAGVALTSYAELAREAPSPPSATSLTG